MTSLGSIADNARVAEAERFLASELPNDWHGIGAMPSAERPAWLDWWRETLRKAGYLGLSWPVEYGGAGLSIADQAAIQGAFARAGVPHLPWPTDGFSFNLIGPTVLHWGTDDQKRQFIPGILSGEYRFCQGYSEPDAGSDLFNVRTRAVNDGSAWRINGQKTWQTAGTHADWIFALVRTSDGERSADGLSLMLLPLDQDGIEVRPIKTMTGHEEFNEVFFKDAVCAHQHLVGGEGNGAKVAISLLGWERGTGSVAVYVNHQLELERLCKLARQLGRNADPHIRQRLAWCWSKVEIYGLLSRQAIARAASGQPPGPESSILKLFVSEYHLRLTELAVDIVGMDAATPSGEGAVAMLGADPLGAPNTPLAWAEKFMIARAAVIYGGSSQIQRSTLGERVLGLPRASRP